VPIARTSRIEDRVPIARTSWNRLPITRTSYENFQSKVGWNSYSRKTNSSYFPA
jgi:hypothetical protein